MALQCAAGEPSDPPEMLRELLSQDANGIAYIQGGRALFLVGVISPATQQAVTDAVAANSNIDTIYVDSVGGDVRSAMSIGAIVKQREWKVVVNGVCMSACFNYVLSAGSVKHVMPGSLVAIHDLTVLFREKAGMKSAAVPDARATLNAGGDTDALLKLNTLMADERAYLARMGMKRHLHQVFERYAKRRQLVYANRKRSDTAGANCPAIEFWALDEKQMKSIGIGNVNEFAYPGTDALKADLLKNAGVAPGTVFFGDAGLLDTFCRESTGFFDMLRVKLGLKN